jgi:hypothetical protein
MVPGGPAAFYPTVALTALLSILRDDTLAIHHAAVLQVWQLNA